VEGISIEGLLNQYSKNSTNAMFTSIPGRVVGTPNLAEQRVDVQILVNKVTTDNVSREHTVLLNVPLVFQGSQSSQFSFPVVSGDTVLLVFSQRSIDRFKLGGKEPHTPADFRKYSKNDAMALPGLFSFTDAINNPSKRTLSHSTNDAVVSHNIGTSNECEVRLKASGGIVINAPGNDVEINTGTAIVNASVSTTINSPDTNVTGNLHIQGHLNFVGATGSADVVASGKSLVSHTHTGDSGGSTSPPN
jgi:phage baseplate assembly protein gpV